MYTDFVPSEYTSHLEKSLQPAPFVHDPLAETSGKSRNPHADGFKNRAEVRGRRKGTPDSLDEILGPVEDEGDDFVSDDDGAGYTNGINGHGKRTNGHLDEIDGYGSKRRATYQSWQPRLHQSFQPSSTPWRGNRRYLCTFSRLEVERNSLEVGLNLTGFVWTVDQDTYHTVTVEFYDREFHRDSHFTDPYLYDKACLSKISSSFCA